MTVDSGCLHGASCLLSWPSTAKSASVPLQLCCCHSAVATLLRPLPPLLKGSFPSLKWLSQHVTFGFGSVGLKLAERPSVVWLLPKNKRVLGTWRIIDHTDFSWRLRTASPCKWYLSRIKLGEG
ncbi:unnamed protein product [Effrenium voratum]|nr:unnamed protein product [Effrenium voratum]